MLEKLYQICSSVRLSYVQSYDDCASLTCPAFSHSVCTSGAAWLRLR